MLISRVLFTFVIVSTNWFQLAGNGGRTRKGEKKKKKTSKNESAVLVA